MSSITDITFGLKDVVAIVVGLGSIGSFIYAMKRASDKHEEKLISMAEEIEDHKKEVTEKFIEAKASKKTTTELIYAEIAKVREENDVCEKDCSAKFTALRTETKEINDKVSGKLDALSTQVGLIGTSLAELTGYIKAKQEKP